MSEILVDPVHGEFDVDAADRYIQTLKYTVRDPHWPNTFLVSVDEDGLEDYLQARRANPDRFPGAAIRIGLGPTRISIACSTQLNAPARQFVKWLRERYNLRFLDDEFNDLTENVDENLDYLFGTPP